MRNDLLILIIEAIVVYFIVLGAHAMRHRWGRAHFFALMGGLTAIMSWITDAGVKVDVGGITFMVGSTVFYTSLLLGVFVVYVFDGPRATRIAISTVAGVSAMVPIIAIVIHLQMRLAGHELHAYVPEPSLRINTASVLTTIADLIFLAIAWEFLGKAKLYNKLWLRTFLTLLGVMWLDVLLFNTGAFAGEDNYLKIMSGTFLSRLFICLFAFPFLYSYIQWQNKKVGMVIEDRPVLAILKEVAEIKKELTIAQEEIEFRKRAEEEKRALIEELQKALSEVKTLQGFLPICANCKKIRDDDGYWQQMERYIQERSDAKFTHAICPECTKMLYPELDLGQKDNLT